MNAVGRASACKANVLAPGDTCAMIVQSVLVPTGALARTTGYAWSRALPLIVNARQTIKGKIAVNPNVWIIATITACVWKKYVCAKISNKDRHVAKRGVITTAAIAASA